MSSLRKYGGNVSCLHLAHPVWLNSAADADSLSCVKKLHGPAVRVGGEKTAGAKHCG